MLRKLTLAILCAVSVGCCAVGLAACSPATVDGGAEETLTIQTAYTTATSLGYSGTVEEFSSQLAVSEDVSVVKVELNELGELIITLSNGTVTNMGAVDLSCSHTYSDWTVEVAAGCTSSGLNVRECTKCGHSEYEVTEPTGHDIIYSSHNQSCHEYECSVCGYRQEEHTFGDDGSCTVCGYEAEYTLGLEYTYSEQTNSYAVTGMSTTVRNLATIVVPELYKNRPVTSIGDRAFLNCHAESITLPESITSIGERAFYSLRYLKSINIPEGVTEIGDKAFTGCRQLESIKLPQNLTYINELTFGLCDALKNIEIPASVTGIGDGAFRACKALTEIVIPEGVDSLGDAAFSLCISLSKITLPETITHIGYSAFAGCPVETMYIPASVTEIGYGLFLNCSALKEVDFGCVLTEIPKYMFRNCSSLERFEIPETVTQIGQYAFSGCTALTTLVIPDSVTSIEYAAFSECTALTKLEISAVITIAGTAFSGCTSLTEIVLHEGISSISVNAFSGCSVLTTLVIPESVTVIGAGALLNTDLLTEITYGGTMQQWKQIEKSSGWKTEDNIIKDLVIHCTDGDLEYIW